MQAITVASKLDWSGWFRGLVGAFVSGGAGAVGGGVGAITLDPMKFNLEDGMGATFKLMGIAFAISAIVSLAKYLQTHPTPEPLSQP